MYGTATARSSTGVAGLDDVLHGGLLPHRIYLVEGDPGAGKTTLALQFLLEGVRLGERCLYVTLSESADELAAGAASHGWTLDGIDVVELVVDERELDADRQLTMFHAADVELSDTTRRILEAVERIDASRVVLDSLSELRLLAHDSLRYRRQILALKQFFVGRRCTVTLLDDRTGDRPDGQLQSIAHGVISLEHRAPVYGQALRQLRVAKLRGSDFRSGYHDLAIVRGGLVVCPRLAGGGREGEPDDAAVGGTVSSGVEALDALLGGGVDRGTSTLLIGAAGCGKSTIALQYASAAAARGEHACVFTFDESRATLRARAEALGMDLPEGAGAGRVLVRKIDPAEMSPGQFAHLVRGSVERDGARMVIIDSLNGFLHSMPDQRFLTAQLHQLLAFLNNRGVVTFVVVAQSGMLGTSMSTPVDASYLADTVVTLRFFEHEGRVRKAISVLKKRSGAHEETIRELSFDGAGLRLGEPLVHLRGVLTGVPVEREAEPASSVLG